MADFPQQYCDEVHVPGRNVSPSHPGPAPYYPVSVLGQPHGYAGVVPDVVSIDVVVTSH